MTALTANLQNSPTLQSLRAQDRDWFKSKTRTIPEITTDKSNRKRAASLAVVLREVGCRSRYASGTRVEMLLIKRAANPRWVKKWRYLRLTIGAGLSPDK